MLAIDDRAVIFAGINQNIFAVLVLLDEHVHDAPGLAHEPRLEKFSELAEMFLVCDHPGSGKAACNVAVNRGIVLFQPLNQRLPAKLPAVAGGGLVDIERLDGVLVE